MDSANRVSYLKILVVTGIALATNVTLYAAGSASGATWDVGQPFLVGIGMVLGATLIPMLLGGLVAKVASAKWPRLRSVLAWGVLVFAILGAPSGWLASGDSATGVALGLMHVTVGVTWFFGVKK